MTIRKIENTHYSQREESLTVFSRRHIIMERCDFPKVWSDNAGVRLYCTDSSEADTVISQLKKFFPNMRIHEKQKLPSGEIWFYHIKELSSQDASALWWIIKQLCSRGWEPIGAASYVYSEYTSTDFHYQFKPRPRRNLSRERPFNEK